MIREVPGWQSGYIGAKASTYDTFDWVSGPAVERFTFWYGLGVNGLRYLSGSRRQGDQAGRKLFEYDPKPAFEGNRRRLLVQPNRNNESFLFTNWAGGKEYSAECPEEYRCDSQSPPIRVGKCQLSSGMPGEAVAI